MSFSIRQLIASDALAYRTLRLRALTDEPFAFGESYDEAYAKPESYWLHLFDGKRAFWGGFIGDTLSGAVNFVPEQSQKSAHRGLLLGMYVAPKARGTGMAEALVNTVLDHARGKVLQVHLGVGALNIPAQKLYARAGFETYATEPRGLFVNGTFIDEHLMVKFLDREEV